MMDKYIVEIDGNNICSDSDGKSKLALSVKADNGYVVFCTEIPLTPYTEPDMEQVRKEAYDKGYDDATAEIGSDEQAIAEKAYQKGLSDAWEAARKVTQVRKYGGYGDCLEEVFGRHRVPWDVFDYSASEAIEKIRQYEQKQEEQIQVGDEVVGTYTGGEETEPFVIIRKIPEIDPTYYFGIYSKSGEFCQGGLKLKKTGRHFPEIAEVLQKMKES